MPIALHRLRPTHAWLLAGGALAAAAPFAVPTSPILPGPETAGEHVLAFLALLGVFVIGYLRPRPALYGLVAVAVLEGAFRKWVFNDIIVYLFKDFLAVGMYAGAVRLMGRGDWRRSPLVLVPLAGLLVLAVVYTLRAPSLSQGLIGLRGYAVYVPLIWVAPKLLDTGPRITRFLALVLALGVVNSVLATFQTLSGGAWLNKTAAGVRPASIVVDGIGYLRPTGTMLQVGTLAAFLLFPVLIAFGLIMRYRSGRWLWIGLAAIAVLSWGVIYAGSRALLGTTVPSAVVLLFYLAWRRRVLSFLAVPAAAVLGFLIVSNQPFIGGPVREGSDSHFLRGQTITWIDLNGQIVTERISVGSGDPKATGGFVTRAAGRQGPSTPASERPRSRVQAQIDLLLRQGLFGHGTGAMSLGSQYLLPERTEAGESEFVKVAYELGWPGLVFFVWLLAALWFAAAWSSFVASPWRGPATAVALGAATFVPLLTLLTYAFDYPIVALLFYSLIGCALAWGAPVRANALPAPTPTPTAHATRRVAASTASSRAHS